MNKTKIVTNAVCDLTPDEAEALGVIIIPESIIFDGIPYYSNIDFTPETLYAKMRASEEFPTGSQPNVGMYIEAFREAAASGAEDIVLLNMTSRMSGSFNTASAARSALLDEGLHCKIYLIDTLELTHGLGFLVREAARMADAGMHGDEIGASIEALKRKIGIFFVMPSLESARRGGRLGAIKARVAESLNIKPVLTFKDGIVSDVRMAYTFKQALKLLPHYYVKNAKPGGRVTIFHADNMKDAVTVRDMLLLSDPDADIHIEWLGSAIGIYTGEGAVGITFWER